MYDTYGSKKTDSWAVVTGGSDGIGLVMCQKLAKQGYNIAIVSRNESKINAVLKEISAEYPKIKTLCVVADFSKMKSIQDYDAKVAEKLKTLDVGILCVNAGYMCFDLFKDQTNQQVEDQWMINGI